MKLQVRSKIKLGLLCLTVGSLAVAGIVILWKLFLLLTTLPTYPENPNYLGATALTILFLILVAFIYKKD